MSIMIEVPDALADQLRIRAAVSGEDLSTFTAAWLADTLAADEAEAMQGIREGLEDSETGHEEPLEDSLAGMLALLDSRDADLKKAA